ncbi:MAG TPA: PepSY domain-containing protein [Chthoniobacterales bacterium]|jgi:uncharacterized membrane protein YkoI|nr:PepSY domain-containing protein [Chthoniobacterales bacterium]
MKMTKSGMLMLGVGLAVGVALGVAQAAPTEAQLMKEAKVTRGQAEKTALSKVPKGTIQTGEIENENGKLVWSFDIAKPGTKDIAEVQIDAKTGKIVSVKAETPKDQATEAAADKAKK